MSAQAFLLGLFPPTENEIWNKEIKWSPIPVHVVSHSMEIRDCPVFINAAMASLSDKYKKFLSSNFDALEYVSKYSGVNITNYIDMMYIYDTLFIEKDVGYALPYWTESVFSNTLRELFTIFITHYAHNDVLKRFGK